MKAVVTGATGFLGNNLVKLLLADGHQVSCPIRADSDCSVLADSGVVWWPDAYSSGEAFSDCLANADVVFHCAAQVGSTNKVTPNMREANVELTREIIDIHRQHPSTRLVYCSTVATCAVSEDGNDVTEEIPWNLDKFGMNSGYTITKRIAEQCVLDSVADGVDAVVVNPCYMFGPGDNKLSSCRMILDVCKGAIPAYPAGVNNFVDVRDVARGMILAAEKGRTGNRYILGGDNLRYKEVFDKITGVANAKPVARPLPLYVGKILGLFGDAKEFLTGKNSLLNSSGIAWSFADCRYSSAKAEDELGYIHGSVDDAILAAYDWFVSQGYISVQDR